METEGSSNGDAADSEKSSALREATIGTFGIWQEMCRLPSKSKGQLQRSNPDLYVWLASHRGTWTKASLIVALVAFSAGEHWLKKRAFVRDVNYFSVLVFTNLLSLLFGLWICLLHRWDEVRKSLLRWDLAVRFLGISALFTFASSLMISAYELETPLFELTMLGYSYLPMSVIVSYFVFHRRYGLLEWLSVGMMSLAILTFILLRERARPGMAEEITRFSGVSPGTMLVFLAVCVSVAASILSERALKEQPWLLCTVEGVDRHGLTPFYVLKVHLDICALLISVCLWVSPSVLPGVFTPFLKEWSQSSHLMGDWGLDQAIIVVVAAAQSWVTALVVREFSTVVKAVVQSISAVMAILISDQVMDSLQYHDRAMPSLLLLVVMILSAMIFFSGRVNLRVLRKAGNLGTQAYPELELPALAEPENGEEAAGNSDSEGDHPIAHEPALAMIHSRQHPPPQPRSRPEHSLALIHPGSTAFDVDERSCAPFVPFVENQDCGGFEPFEKQLQEKECRLESIVVQPTDTKLTPLPLSRKLEASVVDEQEEEKQVQPEAPDQSVSVCVTYALIFVYIVFDAGRTVILQKSLQVTVINSTSMGLVCYICGSLVASYLSLRRDGFWDGLVSAWNPVKILQCLPASFLFALATALANMSFVEGINSALFVVMGKFYTPVAAIGAPFVTGKSYMWLQWGALIILTLASAVFGFLKSSSSGESGNDVPLVAILLVLASAAVSALASLVTEKILKEDDAPFHIKKVRLDVGSIISSLALLPILGAIASRAQDIPWASRPWDTETCPSDSVCWDLAQQGCQNVGCDCDCTSGVFAGWDNPLLVLAVFINTVQGWLVGQITEKFSVIHRAIADSFSLLAIYFVCDPIFNGTSLDDVALNLVALIVPLSTATFSVATSEMQKVFGAIDKLKAKRSAREEAEEISEESEDDDLSELSDGPFSPDKPYSPVSILQRSASASPSVASFVGSPVSLFRNSAWSSRFSASGGCTPKPDEESKDSSL